MQPKNTLKRRMKPLLAICMCGILITVCLHLPQVVYATDSVFPTATAEGTETSGAVTDSGDIETSGGVTDSGDVETSGGVTDSGDVETSGGVTDSGDVSETPPEEDSEVPSEEDSEVLPEDEPDYPYEEEDEPIQPSTPSVAPAKQSSQISVSMADFIYGGKAPNPQVSVQNGDVSTVTLLYKAAGASDATYQAEMPTEVGTYMVQAILPETEQYYKATATDTFTISYLPEPHPSYNYEGEDAAWYSAWFVSDVIITPPGGYQMSIGNRDNFGMQSYTVTEENNTFALYLRKISTGEMTDVIYDYFNIDSHAPVIENLQDGNVYYGDTIDVEVTEKHIWAIYINNSEVTGFWEQDDSGSYTYPIDVGYKKEEYVIRIDDKADNETEISVYLAPAWMEEGIVGAGQYYLHAGEEYSLPAGSDWKVEGDTTVYSGGINFYAATERMHTFAKE